MHISPFPAGAVHREIDLSDPFENHLKPLWIPRAVSCSRPENDGVHSLLFAEIIYERLGVILGLLAIVVRLDRSSLLSGGMIYFAVDAAGLNLCFCFCAVPVLSGKIRVVEFQPELP